MSTRSTKKKKTAPASDSEPDTPAKVDVQALVDPVFNGTMSKYRARDKKLLPRHLQELTVDERKQYLPSVSDLDTLAWFAKSVRIDFEKIYAKTGKMRVEVLVENVASAAVTMVSLDHKVTTRGETRKIVAPNHQTLRVDPTEPGHDTWLSRKIQLKRTDTPPGNATPAPGNAPGNPAPAPGNADSEDDEENGDEEDGDEENDETTTRTVKHKPTRKRKRSNTKTGKVAKSKKIADDRDHKNNPEKDKCDDDREEEDEDSNVPLSSTVSEADVDPQNPFKMAELLGRVPWDREESELADKIPKQEARLEALKELILQDLANADLPKLREKILQYLFYSIRDSHQ
ncbi:uncharacterized protein N7503_004542 [Penicillium pulvis]|uniref:uncharacterized protein n=1 Tax=Penicillium pulvis TaxID=1562058 RepID=UPI0025475ECF|nr:uncharacterized protein N7503_004542 [Penicillium pulvis]KAJ5802092.1 hypothetical protein N7503_004542 [Penicillium pulvis]